jgi:hypothetical protein
MRKKWELRLVAAICSLAMVFSFLAIAQSNAEHIPQDKGAEPAPEPQEGKKGAVGKVTKTGKHNTVETPDGKFVLVDRNQMRVRPGTRTAKVPKYLKAVAETIPAPPASFDHTNGGKVKYPVLGNDRYGDCYYAAMAHKVQTWTGARGLVTNFDVNKLTARYLRLSGGDNGLSDYDVYGNNHNGEFYTGIVGPNGPNKILDHMVVNPSDSDTIAVTMYYFGG